jgi:hypothetical protein
MTIRKRRMTEKRAREILGGFITPKGDLNLPPDALMLCSFGKPGTHVGRISEEDFVYVDLGFSILEPEEIDVVAWWLRNKLRNKSKLMSPNMMGWIRRLAASRTWRV